MRVALPMPSGGPAQPLNRPNFAHLMQFPRVVIPHGGPGIGVPGGDLDVAEVDAWRRAWS
jgi:hypothetical protein